MRIRTGFARPDFTQSLFSISGGEGLRVRLFASRPLQDVPARRGRQSVDARGTALPVRPAGQHYARPGIAFIPTRRQLNLSTNDLVDLQSYNRFRFNPNA